jgi:hypothetical protein
MYNPSFHDSVKVIILLVVVNVIAAQVLEERTQSEQTLKEIRIKTKPTTVMKMLLFYP